MSGLVAGSKLFFILMAFLRQYLKKLILKQTTKHHASPRQRVKFTVANKKPQTEISVLKLENSVNISILCCICCESAIFELRFTLNQPVTTFGFCFANSLDTNQIRRKVVPDP